MEKIKIFLKKCWSNMLIRNLIYMFAVAIVLISFLLFGLNIYTRHNQAINVPSLKGLPESEAAAILYAYDLKYEVIDSVYNPNVVGGSILEQIPPANQPIKKGRTIFLTIAARSVMMNPVPDVEELSQRQAIAYLEAAGFTIASIDYINYKYKDIVVEIEHNNCKLWSGERLPIGSAIVLKVGNGIDAPDESAIDSVVIDSVEAEYFE